MKVSPHFDSLELACPCCLELVVKHELVEKIEIARVGVARPFIVNSGFRCDSHNRAVGGVPESAHLFGWALDIHCNHSNFRYLLISNLLLAGFTRIGVYRYFVHVDCDPLKPPGVIWYGNK